MKHKNQVVLFFTSLLVLFASISKSLAQKGNNTHHKLTRTEKILLGFDERKILDSLKRTSIPSTEFNGIIRHEKTKYLFNNQGIEPKQSFSSRSPLSGPCVNSGFEDSTFNNWAGATGIVPSPTWTNGFVSNGVNASYIDPLARHTIMTNTSGFDPLAINIVTNLPEIPLTAPGGGGVSVRLGNAETGAETERLRYPITVTPSNTSFVYQYAVVLESPSAHSTAEQPRFDIRVYDQNNVVVSGPCGVYSVEGLAAAGDTSFHQFNDPFDPDPGYYKRWTTVGIDLTPYIGTTVTIEFQTSDCTLTGHFGYAYIDATCSQLQANVAFCPNDTILLLTAPGGFASYQWYNAAGVPIAISLGGTNDSLFIHNPTLGQTYTVSMLSVSGCGTSLTALLGYSNLLMNNNVQNVSCYGDNDGFAYVQASGAIPPLSYSWVNAANNTIVTTNDSLLNAFAGTYYVTVSSQGGCSKTDTVRILQPPNPEDTLSIETAFCPGDPAITLYAPEGFNSYTWYANNSASGTVVSTDDSLLVLNPQPGTNYTVEMQGSGPCPIFLHSSLGYKPPPNLPDYIVKSNVFTPDGDGKNDTFDLNQFAYVKEFHIDIFNRWGKKVFESSELTNQWDGKIKGATADEGVYFWMATYIPACTENAPPVENTGYVHLFRKN